MNCEIEVKCSECGAPHEVRPVFDPRNNIVLQAAPCGECLQAREEYGYELGSEASYDAGHKDGLAEGRDDGIQEGIEREKKRAQKERDAT